MSEIQISVIRAGAHHTIRRLCFLSQVPQVSSMSTQHTAHVGKLSHRITAPQHTWSFHVDRSVVPWQCSVCVIIMPFPKTKCWVANFRTSKLTTSLLLLPTPVFPPRVNYLILMTKGGGLRLEHKRRQIHRYTQSTAVRVALPSVQKNVARATALVEPRTMWCLVWVEFAQKYS